MQQSSRAHLTGSVPSCLIVGMDTTESEVVRCILAGDREAYEVLVKRHYAFAFRVAFRITGDAEDAEEVAQEAFLRAYTRLASFRQDSSFSTWVNRIAINTAINFVERRNRERKEISVHLDDTEHPAIELAAATAGPERLLLDREASLLRQQAMDALTPMERTAFTLRHMEEMPIVEIATALRVPANSAKQAVFRAVGKLRRSLGPAGPVPGAPR